MALLSADAMRAFDALIGEVEAAGDAQKKTAWMGQAWHRRLTWLRWLRELRSYVENLHTMRVAIAVSQNERDRRLEALIVKWRSEADRSKLLQGLDCAADLEAMIQ